MFFWLFLLIKIRNGLFHQIILTCRLNSVKIDIGYGYFDCIFGCFMGFMASPADWENNRKSFVRIWPFMVHKN
jgi:hypothetical protein